MGGKLVFTAVSRWNYKSRQPLPPCRGPTTAATLSLTLCVSLEIFSGPSSSNLGFFFFYIYTPHLPSRYSRIHQNDPRPSTHCRDRLAHLFPRIANGGKAPRQAPHLGSLAPSNHCDSGRAAQASSIKVAL